MTYILQNLLAQAQLEILLAWLESWRLGLKAGGWKLGIYEITFWKKFIKLSFIKENASRFCAIAKYTYSNKVYFSFEWFAIVYSPLGEPYLSSKVTYFNNMKSIVCEYKRLI